MAKKLGRKTLKEEDRKSTLLGVRVTETQLQDIEEVMEYKGIKTYSEYLRVVVEQDLSK